MPKIICVTDRASCGEDLLTRVERLARAHPAAIMLREKDLSPAEYLELARLVMNICQDAGVACILHGFYEAARSLGCPALHLPLPRLLSLSDLQRRQFSILGASCHSLAEAKTAADLGCTYITAGHIFATACKRGLPGRGVDFLRQICQAVELPVYAIGGINKENLASVLRAGAAGACSMSGAMSCRDAAAYIGGLQEVCRSFDEGLKDNRLTFD